MFCTHCDGSIYKAKIKKLETIVYLCDICESLWHENDGSMIGKPAVTSLPEYLFQHGLDYMSTEVENLGYDWDKSILNNPAIVFCPHCGTSGIIYKSFVDKLGIYIYFCDTCRAMWQEGQPIKADTSENLLKFLKENSFKSCSEAYLTNFNLEWSKDEICQK